MTPSRLWPFGGPRAGLAFSGRLLVALAVGEAPHVTELPDGLVEPSPTSPNVRSVAELARLVSEALGALGAFTGGAAEVVMALSDLSVTTVVTPAGGRLGARERLEPLLARLSYPASEARTDFWRAGDEGLGAAVREAVARQYEQALEAAECRSSWVDGASTARIPLWAASAGGDGATRALVQLYRTHYAIVVMKGRKLLDFRVKLRSPEDDASVAAELGRLPEVHGSPLGELLLAGEDASRIAARLEGASPLERVVVEQEGEVRQLAAALESLLSRSRRPRR